MLSLLPDGFDSHPKNWCIFKGKCKTYIQANATAFQNDDDKKLFLLSHLNKGMDLEVTTGYTVTYPTISTIKAILNPW